MCAASVFVMLLPAGAAFAADADAPGAEVEELVVTGEKTERSLQDTVASVAVVTSRRIEQENIQTFFDIVNRTANVSETYNGSGFTIRGISSSNVTGGGSSSLASVYVDGAAIPDRTLNNGPLDMWDVAQVEILRGPQSTLQGRSALAGAVVIRTQDPTWEWAGRARVKITDADQRVFSIAGGGPIIADQLAFRLSLEDRKDDGFIRNVTRGDNEDPVDATTIRAKLLVTPQALPGLTVRAGYTHDDRTGGYLFSYSSTAVANPWKNRVNYSDYGNNSKSKTDIATLAADYVLSDTLNLSSVTAWNRVRNRSQFDSDATPQPIVYGDTDDRDDTFSQELRLQYAGERLEGLVGGYYSKRELSTGTISRSTVTTPVTTLIGVLTSPLFGLDAATASFAANTYAAALPQIPVNYRGFVPQEIETFAVFADGRYELTPQLYLLAGFRYDREKNTQATNQVTTFAGAFPNPALYGPLAPVIGGLNQVITAFVAQASASTPANARTFDAFLPKVGLKYDMTEDASLSFVVQRGYRSGGSVANIARSTVVAYDPEYTWNYELALRTSWLDDALTVNATAYYIDWKDQQVLVMLGLNDYDFQTENAGKSHVYGFELEANYRPSTNLDLYASLGHTRTKFDDFQVSSAALPLDLSGSEFSFAPHWTMAAGVNYRWDSGFVANLNANYRGDAFSGTGADQALYAIKARTIVNAKVGYETDHWALSAFANNLFDEEYIQYNQAAVQRAMFGDPRVLGAILEVRW